MPTFKSAERLRETSITIGAGTYTLAGSPTGYQPVSTIGANNYGPFFVTDGTNWEAIIGQYLAGPDRLTRDAVLASSNAGAAVVWPAGTRTIRGGWPAWLALPRVKTKAVAGGAGTTVLTQEEQRAAILIFTGALTGDRVIEVDATAWAWPMVFNNTTGAFKTTFRVTGQTGVTLQRGRRMALVCDGTDVRSDAVHKKAADVASAATLDLTSVDGDIADVTGNTGITAITLEEGREFTTRFTGTPTITNGASLVLPSGANIGAAAGDFAVWRGYAAGVVRCVSYDRADGLGVVRTTLGTEQASTSGTSIDFTGIPAWAKLIIINLTSVSTSGTSAMRVQLGKAAGVETAGYLGSSSRAGGAGDLTGVNGTSGADLADSALAASVRHGQIIIALEDPTDNTWTITGLIGYSNTASTIYLAFSKSLAGVLDRVRLTTIGGTDTFDLGAINIECFP